MKIDASRTQNDYAVKVIVFFLAEVLLLFVGFLCFLLTCASLSFAASTYTITADLTASRTTNCVAPCAVHFSASQTQSNNPSANPFKDFLFEWDFGDSGFANWAHNQQYEGISYSKNKANGPIAGHVYDKPGNYTVTLSASDIFGNSDTKTIQIVVQDPELVFAGKTYCFSNLVGQFTGCPAGATKIVTSNFNTILDYVPQGARRLLLRRGHQWASTGAGILNFEGPGTIGAFGTGAPPLITTAHDQDTLRFSGPSEAHRDWRIMDLEFRGPGGTGGSGGLIGGGRVKQLLIYRVTISQFLSPISIASDITDYLQQENHQDLAIVENEIKNGRGMAFITARAIMYLGNNHTDTEFAPHTVRFPQFVEGIFAHNYLGAPIIHNLKLHALADGDRYSENFVISDNIFVGGNNDWSVTVGPQDHLKNEQVKNGIVERNLFLAGSKTQIHLLLSTSGVVVRSNLFDLAGIGLPWAPRGISVSRRGVEPIPTGNAVYNNTCYVPASRVKPEAICVNVDAPATNTAVYSNLLSAAGATIRTVLEDNGTNTTALANFEFSQPGFVVVDPNIVTNPLGLRLSASSPAVDKGAALTAKFLDFERSNRLNQGNGLDVGAFELQTSDSYAPQAPQSLRINFN